jgi:hypothetical protein
LILRILHQLCLTQSAGCPSGRELSTRSTPARRRNTWREEMFREMPSLTLM